MLDVDKQPDWEDLNTGVVSQNATPEHLRQPREPDNETL